MDAKVSDDSTRKDKKEELDPLKSREKSIIIVGSKNVGKTTMINRFLEKDEKPKPTIAIEYSFGRKAGKSLVKNIVHVWEIGHLDSSLISAAMSGSALTHSPHQTTLLMMLDLSKPESLWTTLEETISVIRSALKISYDPKMTNEMIEGKIKERKRAEEGIDPFPLSTCIIGGKYDEFQEFDLDKKELTGKMLRAIAHNLGAGLHYYSSKDKTLVRKTKDLLVHYGFGAQFVETKCTDYERALAVPAGTDSYSSIDLQFSRSKTYAIFDAVKQMYVSRILQSTKDNGPTLEDPSNDPNFIEPIIDRLKKQREEEINVLLADMLEGRIPQIPIPDPV